MITTEQAMHRVEGLDAEEMRVLAKNRVLGRDVAPVGDSWAEEAPEDLVSQLLRSAELPADLRASVIAGCRDAYHDLQRAVTMPEAQTLADWLPAATHLCGMVDVAGPPELRGLAYALLDMILYTPAVPDDFLPPAVRAAMAYEQTTDRIPVWEKLLNEQPSVAAYAFTALLGISPQSPKIEAYLKLLWRKQIREKWPVDTAFLMRRALRHQGDELLVGVLRFLRKSEAMWPAAEEELARRQWSRQWLGAEVPQTFDLDVAVIEPNIQPSGRRLPNVIMSNLGNGAERCIVTFDSRRHPQVATAVAHLKSVAESTIGLYNWGAVQGAADNWLLVDASLWQAAAQGFSTPTVPKVKQCLHSTVRRWE